MITDSLEKCIMIRSILKKSENRKNGFLKRNVSVNILSLQLFLSFVKVFFLYF